MKRNGRQRPSKADRAERLEALFARLAAHGYRITKPRRAVVEAFARLGRYATAQDLGEMLSRARGSPNAPAVGLATVYRTLDVLREVGAASEQAQPHGETAFLYCPVEHHHHAVCTRCGHVDDVPCASIARFQAALSRELRFTLTQHRLEFFGVCRSCAQG
ncbi:MAG TPA: Fur family transcriptional regulator [Candidatus Eremiobacteraceae bacterium]|nr:Fur family transcriptional regulator [Candidatus Eremiobacteraceae bacterium]